MSLKETLRKSNGKLFEVSGYDDAKIKEYLAGVFSDTDDIILYIDTAHTLTEPFGKNILYTSLYKYDDILTLLSGKEEPDLIILDNAYNIADAPKFSFLLFNIARLVSKHRYNLLFVNQFVYNFNDRVDHKKYVPQYDNLYRTYCTYREIVYDKTHVTTTLNKKPKQDTMSISSLLF